jgi:hypothetical protein
MFLKNEFIVKAVVFVLSSFIISLSFAQTNEPVENTIKAAMNPLADRIFFGAQNYTNFGIGTDNRIQDIFNVQPVIPFNFAHWNLTTRWILPLAFQPDFSKGSGHDFGLGDLKTIFYFNPQTQNPFRWGVGPTIFIPTATKNTLGADKWGIGPALVGEINYKAWLLGITADNTWSFAGKKDRPDINQLTLQPFVNYIVPGTNGFLLTTSPIIIANWEISHDRWTLPVGGGLGYLLRIAGFPVNFTIEGFWNALKANAASDWELRTTVQAIFPKHK